MKMPALWGREIRTGGSCASGQNDHAIYRTLFYIFLCKSLLDFVELLFLFQYNHCADDSQRGSGQQDPEGRI
jgi:hypothetical protein